MPTRRTAIQMLAALTAFSTLAARAAEFQPYEASVVGKAIASGNPVVVHVYAPWCLQCHIQASYLDRLKDDPEFKDIAFFRVDYDNQKDAVAKLGCPRSTVIAYKGGKEVTRMSWGVMKSSVVDVLKAAL